MRRGYSGARVRDKGSHIRAIEALRRCSGRMFVPLKMPNADPAPLVAQRPTQSAFGIALARWCAAILSLSAVRIYLAQSSRSVIARQNIVSKIRA